ncbi:hypothetical protein ACS5PU_14035 [Pedobacter sp. GSP4]|uniref:hypothetical protein n=1 Tax=Pedobacter sp. GSP4 TaxID=3453716 RepID=UPI003EED46A0
MKGLYIFLIGIICYGIKDCAVDKSPVIVSTDTLLIIRKIQSDFLSINKQLKFFKKKSRSASGMSAEGGEVVGYYDKGAIKKIHCVLYGETGKSESEYYFNSKGLFFFYEKDFFYDKPMYLKDFKVKSVVEKRYYLYGNQVIKKIIKPNTQSVLSYPKIKEELMRVMNILSEE